MRDSVVYHLEDPGVHSQDGRLTLIRTSRNMMHPSHGVPVTPAGRLLPSSHIDRRSIIVINIPPTTTHQELSVRFTRHGMIMSIDSVNKPSIQGKLHPGIYDCLNFLGLPAIFAIIEYSREDAAHEAILNEVIYQCSTLTNCY